MSIPRSGSGDALYPSGHYKAYKDTSFLTGESPRTLDFKTDIGKNANNGYIVNDGAGAFTIAWTHEGTNYGDENTVNAGESFSLKGLDIDSLRITWVANSSYRVLAE